jgi:hypothetical protein
LPSSLECVAHVALAAASALAWLGAGSLVLAPLGRSGDRALDGLSRLGAGAVALALLTWTLGWFGLLYAELFVPLLAAGAVLGARELRRLRPFGLPRAWPAWQLALIALIGLYVAIDLVVTCAPISSADALLHHAAAPELFEQRHRVLETPWAWNSYQPYTVEMLVLDGFLVWDGVQGAFAPLLLLFAGTAATGLGAARFAGRTVGLLAATIVLCQPFTTWVGTSTFVEPGLVLAVSLALWNLAHFARTGWTPALVLTGVFAGAAAGMKYQGVAAALLIACGLVLVRDRLTVRRFALAALPALAVALPWYLKNAILTGNPVYPLFFGGANEEADRLARASFEEYGHGTSLLDLVLLPFRLLGDAEAFDRGEFASPLPLLFAPLALLAPRGRRVVAVTLALCAAYGLAWFVGSQHARFLLPLLPPLAVLAAVGMVELARAGRLGRLATVAVTTGALAAGLGITLAYAGQFVPVVAGRESEEQFLLENTSYYAATAWVNDHLPSDAHVAVDHVFVYPFDPEAIVWSADVLESSAGEAETRAFVRRFGITHAVVFANNSVRRRQLDAVGARVIARVQSRPVVSRTLSELGPPEPMLVYELR